MSKAWLRFRDLKARNIVQSWAQLRRKIKHQGFPPGRMTGPNERSWTEEEIDEYREGCPVEGPELRGAAKEKRARTLAAADDSSEPGAGETPEPKTVDKRPRGRPRPRKAESETTDNVSMNCEEASRPPA